MHRFTFPKIRLTIKMNANYYTPFFEIGCAGGVAFALKVISLTRNCVIFGRKLEYFYEY